MSVSLLRGSLVDVAVEKLNGIDGQGKPSYLAAQTLRGRAVRQSEVVRTSTGQEIASIMTIWVSGEQSPLPDNQDRVTAGGLTGIVIERQDGRSVQGDTLDHVRVRIRKE